MLDRPASPSAEPEAVKPMVARDFQPPAMALEDEEPPRAAWWSLYALMAFLGAALVWAFMAKVDQIVVARGELVTSVPTLVVQPLERVGVKSIDVKVGDIVHKGQILASLDPTFAEADVEQLKTKVASYSARQERLEAEMGGKEYVPTANSNQAELLEASLFDERKHEYSAHLQNYDEDLGRVNATLASSRSDVQMADSRIDLLTKIVTMRQALMEKAVTSELQMLEARAQLLDAQRQKAEAEGKIAELLHQTESVRAQRDGYIREWREKTADELVKVRRDLEEAAEDLNKAIRRHDMVTLEAPADAVVLEVAQRSIGSVLREAEVLFTLVPLDAPLQAEVRILPRDVGLVQTGDDVRVKFDAFPFQKYGTARATISTISADSFRPSQNGREEPDAPKTDDASSYFKARVALLDTKLPITPENFRLLPGMTVTAEIKVGTQRVISYLLYPISKGLDESLREPRR